MKTMEVSTEQIGTAELERYRDAEWAMRDPEVQRTYHGQWVVAYERKIIAQGPDSKEVVAQACRLVKNQVHHPIFCAREDPEAWLQHAPDMTMDFSDG